MKSKISFVGGELVVTVGKHSMVASEGVTCDGQFSAGSKVHYITEMFGHKTRMPGTVICVSPDGKKLMVQWGSYKENGDGTVTCSGNQSDRHVYDTIGCDEMFKYEKKTNSWFACGCPTRPGGDPKRPVRSLHAGWQGGKL